MEVGRPTMAQLEKPITMGPSRHEIYRFVVLATVSGLFLRQGLGGGMVYPYVAAALAMTAAVRTAMIRLKVDESGLKVRNRWRSYAIPWADIRDVVIEDRLNLLLGAAAGARTSRVVVISGRKKIRISATTTARSTRGWFKRLSEPLADLRTSNAHSALVRRVEEWRSSQRGG